MNAVVKVARVLSDEAVCMEDVAGLTVAAPMIAEEEAGLTGLTLAEDTAAAEAAGETVPRAEQQSDLERLFKDAASRATRTWTMLRVVEAAS